MFFMNRRSGGRGSMSGPGTGPMGFMGGLPGPQMMLEMMPMMAARTLASEAPEERGEHLLDVVAGIFTGATADLPDDEYDRLVSRLSEMLRDRGADTGRPVDPCCG